MLGEEGASTPYLLYFRLEVKGHAWVLMVHRARQSRLTQTHIQGEQWYVTPVALPPACFPSLSLIGWDTIICCRLHQWEVKASIVCAVSGQTTSCHRQRCHSRVSIHSEKIADKHGCHLALGLDSRVGPYILLHLWLLCLPFSGYFYPPNTQLS